MSLLEQGAAHFNCTLSIPRGGSPNFPDIEENLLRCRIWDVRFMGVLELAFTLQFCFTVSAGASGTVISKEGWRIAYGIH